LSCCVDLYPTLALALERGGDKSLAVQGEIYHVIRLKILNNNLAPPLSKGRLGGVEIYASNSERLM
jgi:hypothetical protein